MKIVINRCFGGFCISRAAAEHMAKNGSEQAKLDLENGTKYFYGFGYSKKYKNGYDRADPLLVAAIEELGDAADGNDAKLKVVEIPDGISWEIDDYDGKEQVKEKSSYWF